MRGCLGLLIQEMELPATLDIQIDILPWVGRGPVLNSG